MKKQIGLVSRILFAGIAALVMFSALPSNAQASPWQSGGQDEEFVDRFNNQFKTRPPKVGSQMLDGLKAFDANGKEFKFESLKGKHTVIVFGCLT